MNSQPSARPARVQTQGGLLTWLLSLAFGAAVSIIGSLAVGTMIEWVGMHVWWKDQGVRHSRDMVSEDLGYLAEYRRSLLTDDTVAFAKSWADAATKAAGAVGVLSLIKKGTEPPGADGATGGSRTGQLLRSLAPYLTAMVYVWQDAFIRLAIVYLALPAFAIAFLIGLVDGLGRRDIRKWCGGRESSFVYHHAKRLLWPAFTFGFFVYLTWPTGGFNPAWAVLPFCAASACTVSLMAATFKKYL
jgi:integrating conjugative element membrane protein (TIGR03747 family)